MMNTQAVPPLSSLLGLLQPGAAVPDPDDMRITAEVAIESGMIARCDGIDAAVDALVACCRIGPSLVRPPADIGIPITVAAIDLKGPFTAFVEFSESSIRTLASTAVRVDYERTPFIRALGPMPPEVAKRVECMAERPAMRRMMAATAIDHLSAAALDLAARVPGAIRYPDGSVAWCCAAPTHPDLKAAIAWISLPGPGVLASRIIVHRT